MRGGGGLPHLWRSQQRHALCVHRVYGGGGCPEGKHALYLIDERRRQGGGTKVCACWSSPRRITKAPQLALSKLGRTTRHSLGLGPHHAWMALKQLLAVLPWRACAVCCSFPCGMHLCWSLARLSLAKHSWHLSLLLQNLLPVGSHVVPMTNDVPTLRRRCHVRA